MNRRAIHSLRCLFSLPLLTAMAAAQGTSSTPSITPIPYSSVSELNVLLSQLEQSAKGAQDDLTKLRIERWKTDSGTKRQTAGNVESIERNLQQALPQMIAELRNSPESLTSTFKVYRNLDALYDVFGSVVENAGAFGSKDEFQSLQNDMTALERSRRSFAERMETLAGSKETELTHLRTALQHAQAALETQPPKKIVVDDTQPPPKPAKKKAPAKTVPKPGSATAPPPPQPPQQSQQR
jgi:hypothetical protein